VIVNDLSVAMDGSGRDTTPLSLATKRIQEMGGVAEADHSDVATPDGARNLIQHALDEFGRIDILINNAGIYAIDAFPDVELDDLRRQFDVHVGGSFLLAKACWPHMVGAGYGRIVLTTSTGALGIPYLTAYGTAKAAVLGLARTLATVAAESDVDIKVNALAPMATTRMAEAATLKGADPPPDPERDPSLVSPMVALLVHETCPVNGEAFMSGMRRYSRLFMAETSGYVHPSLDVTPETLAAAWDLIIGQDRYRAVNGTVHWSEGNKRAIQATPLDQ
jgi:NAD(P)-dependent dehydrogenase (short-subunit alcohol dehydrogenase family)